MVFLKAAWSALLFQHSLFHLVPVNFDGLARNIVQVHAAFYYRIERGIQDCARVQGPSRRPHSDEDRAVAFAEVMSEQTEAEGMIAGRHLEAAQVLTFGREQVFKHLRNAWVMDLAHHHGNVYRLDANYAGAVDAFDIDLFARIVCPDDDGRSVVDFFHGQGDGDALVIGAGVDDDLGGIFYAGARHDVFAGGLAAHQFDEVWEWI